MAIHNTQCALVLSVRPCNTFIEIASFHIHVDVNVSVVSYHAVRSAASLAAEGKFMEARSVPIMTQRMMMRARWSTNIIVIYVVVRVLLRSACMFDRNILRFEIKSSDGECTMSVSVLYSMGCYLQVTKQTIFIYIMRA